MIKMTVDPEDVANDYFSDSDYEAGDEEHKRLLAAIAKLDKRKRVLPTERREPSLQVSEFHLSKDTSNNENTVHLGELAKSLRLKSSHVEIARKLKTAQRKAKTLPKPLEKPVAEKIKREVAYGNVKEQLGQWDPIVIRNRVADSLVFPLPPAESQAVKPQDFLDPNQGATELERKIAEVLNDSPSVQKEREEKEEYPLSLEEMIQRRKELARLRAQESYRQAKAHKQNKIKSKSYHRHARRDRIRKQIKEFEELQKTNPEAALERLEEIEKQRILERASLRHHSSGKWAKSLAVRAKYDPETRKALAEQLRVGKDIKQQKIQAESESSDEEPVGEQVLSSSDNPWMLQSKTEAEIDDFLSGYRKYYDQQAKKCNEDPVKDEDNLSNVNSNQSPADAADSIPQRHPREQALIESSVVSYSESQEDHVHKPIHIAKERQEMLIQSKKKGKKNKKAKTIVKKKGKGQKDLTPVKTRPEKFSSPCSGGTWIVTPIKDTISDKHPQSVEELFEDLPGKIAAKAQKKISKLRSELEESSSPQNVTTTKRKNNTLEESRMLEMKKQRLQIDLDENLDESNSISNARTYSPEKELQNASSLTKLNGSGKQNNGLAADIDPHKFLKTRSIHLKTALPDEVTFGDGIDDSDVEGGEDEKIMTISEAFADDDVVADFSTEKQDAIQKSKPEDINLHLPGWGEWAGHNIKPNSRKKRRFMVKMPSPPPRRDQNKGNLIVNENEDSAARKHLVSDLPFPFTSVKDYEASVRAPISNTFIPESAFRKLVRPPVRTKLGTVINPIDKQVLIQKENSKRK